MSKNKSPYNNVNVKGTPGKVSYNFRSSFKDAQVDYIASLRDGAFFDLYGIQANIKIPTVENNTDEYINYQDEDFYTQQTILVPKFKEYRQILSKYGMTAEENYPLEVLIPTALHLPRNSRIILSEWNAEENKVDREWKVLSTVTKQLSDSKNYTHIAYCVPARVNILSTSAINNASCKCSVDTVIANVIYKTLASISCICTGEVDNNRIIPEPPVTATAICINKYKLYSPSIYYYK